MFAVLWMSDDWFWWVLSDIVTRRNHFSIDFFKHVWYNEGINYSKWRDFDVH